MKENNELGVPCDHGIPDYNECFEDHEIYTDLNKEKYTTENVRKGVNDYGSN